MLKKEFFQKEGIVKLQALFAALAVLTIPFSMAIPNIFLIISVILLFFSKNKINYKPIIPISIFVAITTAVYLFNNNFITDFSVITKYLLIILMSGVLINTNSLILKKSLVIGVNLSIGVSILKIIYLYYLHNVVDLSNGDTIFEVIYLNRPFLGFLIFISSIVTINLYNTNDISKKIVFFILVLNIGFVFFIAARLTMLTYLIAGILYFTFFYKIKSIYKIIISIGLVAIFLTTISLNDNIKNRFKFDKGIEAFIENEPRFVIWPCSINLIENSNWFIGNNSYSEMVDELSNCYSEVITDPDKKDWYLFIKYNPHNQFFYIILTSGIIGLVGFLYFLISLLLKSNNFMNLSIIIAFLLFITLDCVLYRQVGCYFTAIVIWLSNSNYKKKAIN